MERSEQFVPAELSEIKMSSKEAKVKIAMMVEQFIPLLENSLIQIRFNTGNQAEYRITEAGDILFFVSQDVDLEEIKDVVADLKRLRVEMATRLKSLLHQGGHLKGYQYASERELNRLREKFLVF